jgi:hypothetical protein
VKIKSERDFFSGLMFMAIGIAFAWGAFSYRIGNAARMGPGYFPLLLGAVLTALGGFIVFQSLVFETEDGEEVGPWAWKPLGFIAAANLAFGVMIGGLPSIGLPPMGLIAGIVAVTFVSALAAGKFRFNEVAIIAGVLSAGSYVAFIVLLDMRLPVWP